MELPSSPQEEWRGQKPQDSSLWKVVPNMWALNFLNSQMWITSKHAYVKRVVQCNVMHAPLFHPQDKMNVLHEE